MGVPTEIAEIWSPRLCSQQELSTIYFGMESKQEKSIHDTSR